MFNQIKDKGILLSVFGDTSDIHSGSTFYEDNKPHPLEWGIFQLENNFSLQRHIHKIRPRITPHITMEFFFIIQGKLKADIYNQEKERVASIVLKPGNFLCSYSGGHSFKSLENDTKFIEVKNGPFVGAEADKEKF